MTSSSTCCKLACCCQLLSSASVKASSYRRSVRKRSALLILVPVTWTFTFLVACTRLYNNSTKWLVLTPSFILVTPHALLHLFIISIPGWSWVKVQKMAESWTNGLKTKQGLPRRLQRFPPIFLFTAKVPKSVLTTGSSAISSTCLKKGRAWAVDKFVMLNLQYASTCL